METNNSETKQNDSIYLEFRFVWKVRTQLAAAVKKICSSMELIDMLKRISNMSAVRWKKRKNVHRYCLHDAYSPLSAFQYLSGHRRWYSDFLVVLGKIWCVIQHNFCNWKMFLYACSRWLFEIHLSH